MQKLNVVGLVGMILSLVGLLILPLWLGIAGLICGIVGCNKHDCGKGMAITSLVVGAIDIVYVIIVAMIAMSAV